MQRLIAIAWVSFWVLVSLEIAPMGICFFCLILPLGSIRLGCCALFFGAKENRLDLQLYKAMIL